MVVVQRRRHSAECKAKVALEAIKGERTVNEVVAEYGVQPGQIALQSLGYRKPKSVYRGLAV